MIARICFLIFMGCGCLTLFAVSPPVSPVGEKTAWVADPTSKTLTNPEKNLKKSAKKGRKLFMERCVVCHGQTGKGDGPGGRALDPKPADLGSETVQSQEDGEVFWKISEGRLPMITWKHILSEKDRWHLVNFIRTLKKD